MTQFFHGLRDVKKNLVLIWMATVLKGFMDFLLKDICRFGLKNIQNLLSKNKLKKNNSNIEINKGYLKYLDENELKNIKKNLI